MPNWMVAAKKADFDAIADRFQISPVTARLIRNRGLVTEDEIARYLNGGLSLCHDPALLPDVLAAANMLADCIRDKKRIRVVGDYDVDGICASAILVRGLSFLGGDADYVIPHRVREGYGINDAIVHAAKEDGIDTILTCDNGIAANEQAALAASYGIHMIITDHHDVPLDPETGCQKLPVADAVVNPKRESDPAYPFAGICGAYVAYKLLQVLFHVTGREPEAETLMGDLTELAAVATVCDVMPLTDENRLIVREGMRRMANSAFAGLQALSRVNGIADGVMTVYRLGFVIGPCLNATGRLDSAKRGVELLLTDDADEAVRIAAELKELNVSRKQMTERYLADAVEAVRTGGLEKDKVLVVDLPDAHEAVAGIVAGRVRELFHRPVIILTGSEDGTRGSARSVPAYDMFQALSAHAELFRKFGGHPMAAGLTLQREVSAGDLRKCLNEACTLSKEELEEALHLDMELPPSVLSFDLMREWERLEPFGNGNERPLFAARGLRLLRGRVMGKNKNVARYTVADPSGNRFEVMLFQGLDRFDAFLDETFGAGSAKRLYDGQLTEKNDFRIHIAYRPDINEYQGNRTIQLVMEDYRRCG